MEADLAHPPWRAVGRLNLAGTGHCTAVLIAPDRALTAAHCLRAHDMTLLLGYSRGEWEAAVAVTDARRLGGLDVALLELGERAGDRFGHLAPVAFDREMLARTRNQPLALGGYSTDRPHLLLVHEGCGAFRFLADTVQFTHGCDAARGVSGGPLVRREGGEWRIAGLHVATTRDGVLGIAVSGAAILRAMGR